jgi:lysyl-tRNA synthetase class I
VFIYLFIYLGNTTNLITFTDENEDLEKVYDFFENIRDEKLVEEYLGQALSTSFFTFDRKEWINRKINILEEMKK